MHSRLRLRFVMAGFVCLSAVSVSGATWTLRPQGSPAENEWGFQFGGGDAWRPGGSESYVAVEWTSGPDGTGWYAWTAYGSGENAAYLVTPTFSPFTFDPEDIGPAGAVTLGVALNPYDGPLAISPALDTPGDYDWSATGIGAAMFSVHGSGGGGSTNGVFTLGAITEDPNSFWAGFQLMFVVMGFVFSIRAIRRIQISTSGQYPE